MDYEQVPSTSMQVMEIEEPNHHQDQSSLRNNNGWFLSLHNSKKKIALVVVLVLSMLTVFAVVSNSQGSMTWPPPEVDPEQDLDTVLQKKKHTNMQLYPRGEKLHPGAVTIKQKLHAETTNTVHRRTGESLVTDLELTMDDNDIVFSSNEKEIQVTTNHIAMSMISTDNHHHEMLDLRYDSDKPDPKFKNDPDIQDLQKHIGRTTTIDLDDHGQVLQTSDDSNTNNKMNKHVSAQNQVDQIFRFHQIVSSYNANTDDVWDFENFEIADATFHGTATLLGLLEYDSSNCVVIQLEGRLQVDSNQRRSLQASNMYNGDNMHHGVSFTEGTLHATFYWDYEQVLTRYSQANVNLLMSVSNPLHPTETMELPTAETLTVYSSIVS